MSMFSMIVIYTIVQSEEAFCNRYDLVTCPLQSLCKICEMQRSINDFFTG